jgi:hypothetical protein
VFLSIKPLHVSVFLHDHLQGVLRCALCRYYSSRWFAFVEFVLLRIMWPHVYVICACLVFLSVCDLLANCLFIYLFVFCCWYTVLLALNAIFMLVLYNKCGNMHSATLKIKYYVRSSPKICFAYCILYCCHIFTGTDKPQIKTTRKY